MTNSTHNRQQKQSAILAVYKTHVDVLKQFIGRIFITNKQDVDDIVQEAFLLAYRAESKKEIEKPKSFLFKIAKNVALSKLRKKSRRPTDYLEDFDTSDVLVTEWTLEEKVMAQQTLGIRGTND